MILFNYYEGVTLFSSLNNIFTFEGKTIFTGGQAPEIYTPIHNFITNYFYYYYIGCNENIFRRSFATQLKRIEYIFYTMLLTEMKKDTIFDDTILKPYFIEYYKSNKDYKGDIGFIGNTQASDTNRSNSTTDVTSNSTSSSIGEGQSRNLDSLTPQSNISFATNKEIDTPIDWSFASSMNDGFTKSKSQGETNTTSSSETNSTSNTNSTTDVSNDTSEKGLTDFESFRYNNENNLIDIYQKVSDFLHDKPNLFDYLINNLKFLFLYEEKGGEVL